MCISSAPLTADSLPPQLLLPRNQITLKHHSSDETLKASVGDL